MLISGICGSARPVFGLDSTQHSISGQSISELVSQRIKSQQSLSKYHSLLTVVRIDFENVTNYD